MAKKSALDMFNEQPVIAKSGKIGSLTYVDSAYVDRQPRSRPTGASRPAKPVVETEALVDDSRPLTRSQGRLVDPQHGIAKGGDFVTGGGFVRSEVVDKSVGSGDSGSIAMSQTKSGKPIFKGCGALHKAYKEFTPEDHDDAAEAHDRAGDSKRAEQHRRVSKARKGGGEGSKGGKVIGHTKSGKPIYGEAPGAPGPHEGAHFGQPNFPNLRTPGFPNQ